MQGEQEVLFSLGSVFKIDKIQFDSHLRLWKIEITATDDGSKSVEDYIHSIREEIEYISPTILFGALLFNEMGQIDKADNYFHMLLKTLPRDHQDVADVYDQTANIFAEKGEIDAALQNYICAYEIRKTRFSGDDIRVANSLHNLGFIHKQKGEYVKAMNYYKEVLTIDEKNYPNDHTNKAHTMICIGLVHHITREYDLALDYMMKAYEMYQRLLPTQHPYISSTLWHIGSVYENKLEYNCALDYYICALDMDEKILPNDHPDYKKNFDRVMQLYTKMEEYVHDSNYCQVKLTNRNSYVKIAHSIMKIGEIIGDSDDRLNCFKQALSILETCDPHDDSALIFCLRVLSTIHLEKRLFKETLQNLIKILSIQEQTLSKNHSDIGSTLQQIGEVHFEMKNYPEALEFLTQCLEIYKANYSQAYDNMKKIQNDIDKAQTMVRRSPSNATAVTNICSSAQVDNNNRCSDMMFRPTRIQENDQKSIVKRSHRGRTRACCILQ